MENEKEYVVYITETLQKRVVVKAQDENEAIQKVSQEYYDGEIVLDYNDYLGATDFDACEKD